MFSMSKMWRKCDFWVSPLKRPHKWLHKWQMDFYISISGVTFNCRTWNANPTRCVLSQIAQKMFALPFVLVSILKHILFTNNSKAGNYSKNHDTGVKPKWGSSGHICFQDIWFHHGMRAIIAFDWLSWYARHASTIWVHCLLHSYGVAVIIIKKKGFYAGFLQYVTRCFTHHGAQ